MPKLVLLRHGESCWNKENIFTGWVDVSLSPQGIQEALDAGDEIADIPFDVCYTSTLLRASVTLALALSKNKKSLCPIVKHDKEPKYSYFNDDKRGNIVPVIISKELNERNYGDLQGKNKGEVLEEVGKEQFQEWRRSSLGRPPGGESLQDVMDRVIPFFQNEIISKVVQGENVLIVGHGNTFRAILKDLENVSNEDIVKVEVPTGRPIIFDYEEGFWSKTSQLST